MPDINNCISYDLEINKIVEEKIKDPNFKYKNWSDEDLEKVRKNIRDYYRKEQKGRCVYCREPLSLQSASNCHVEHILPKSKYTSFIFEPKNLCVICADCNEIKREQETLEHSYQLLKRSSIVRYPKSSNAFLIVHPHFDDYDDHIKIIHGGYYIDLTPKGNKTIGVCKLNRFTQKFGWPDEPSTLDEVLQTAQMLIESQSKEERFKKIKQLQRQLNSNQNLLWE
ncbi:hypothetical protein JZM36_15555 [Acinetobacter pittii]|uniref:HNH endonuclease n=1 Tax=Acinetobacter pittii TaxID=48296 RepID=UPI00198072EE|nr:HNH endonuclease [Acinetobacter pittii]MBN6518277.1 hypothetical protein [Acinetobacter pittii]